VLSIFVPVEVYFSSLARNTILKEDFAEARASTGVITVVERAQTATHWPA
jgi:hypothetical protein